MKTTKYFSGKADFFSRQQRQALVRRIRTDDDALRAAFGADAFRDFYTLDDIVTARQTVPPFGDEDAAKRVARQMIDVYHLKKR